MLEKEKEIIKILAEFNFGFVDNDEFSLSLDNYYKNYLCNYMNEYSKMGWREKIIFSFFLVIYDRKDFLRIIEEDIFLSPNGKELKSYLLVITLMSKKAIKLNIFDELLNKYDLFEPQKEWVFASCQLTDENDFNLNRSLNSDKYLNKYLKSIEVINKIRLLNHLDLIKTKFY